MHWCQVHGRWEHDQVARPFGFTDPLAAMTRTGAPIASALPAFPSAATPAFSATPASGYGAPQPRSLPAIPVAAPTKTMPASPAEATPSGPPEWFLRADAALNGALGGAGGALSAVARHSAAERHHDVFYLDRLTESLRKWEAKLQELADPFRKSSFH